MRATCSVDGCDRIHYAKTYCELHWSRNRAGLPLDYVRKVPAQERFWRFIAMGPNGCWAWAGALNASGYGCLHGDTSPLAHKVSYEIHVGPVPAGLQVDHLCFNRRCVNPQHLEAVEPGVNLRRATARITECPHGHSYDEVNTSFTKAGHRRCRACAAERSRVNRARRAESLA